MEYYISRDISWLSFNHRVLQEAGDPRVPLYERIKFLAIYSSNLDEFFRVRVASLRSFRDLRKETRREMDFKPKKELRQIRRIVQKQQAQFGKVFRHQILPRLKEQGIELIDDSHFSAEQKKFARHYFDTYLQDRLNIQFIDEDKAPPFLKNKGLYFIVSLAGQEALGLVEIPSDEFPRFHMLPSAPGRNQIAFLDDILRFNLSKLFDRPVAAAYAVKLSRDAELHIDDEFSGDLVAKIKAGLEERNIGLPTRFLYDSRMSKEILSRLKKTFSLKKPDLIPGARYHNFNDFFSFPDPTHNPKLHNPELPPLPHPYLEEAASITDLVRGRDQLLHFPYQRYSYVPRWIWEAANDPSVAAIKITLYRVASDSEVVKALLHARKMGKRVTAFIEAKARFDESSNIHWGEELQKAGAQVIYSYPEIKVHTKLLLIIREEEGAGRPYAYIGTGNFNEKTARIYCDHALLTANRSIAEEVERIFLLLERRVILPQCKKLLVAPFTLRDTFEALIDREIAHAAAGKPAYMILKMNSLEDPGMVEKLYEASRAGVSVRLIVRGICSLMPGIEGVSDNIEAISIVDRFLEHARVYIFGNDGNEKMYLASADWMTRNLDRRVEVAVPIEDPGVYRQIRHIVDLQWRDNTKARLINAEQNNPYREKSDKAAAVRAQIDTYRYLEAQTNASSLSSSKADVLNTSD